MESNLTQRTLLHHLHIYKSFHHVIPHYANPQLYYPYFPHHGCFQPKNSPPGNHLYMKLTFSKDYSPHPLSCDIGLSPSQPLHHSSTYTCRAKKPLLPPLIHNISHLELDIIAYVVHNPHSQLQLKPLCSLHSTGSIYRNN